MKRNFVISSDISIQSNGRIFNLHEDYNFLDLKFNPNSRELILTWREKNKDNYINILFHNTNFLKIKQRDNAYPVEECGAIRFIGVLNEEDEEVMDGFLPEFNDKSGHIIFSFVDEFAIKVGAELSVLKCDDV